MPTATQNPIAITAQNFDQEVTESQSPILLQFWATWCVPCNLMKRAVAKAAEALEGTARVGLVNIDQQPDLVAKFGIKGTPTFILVRGDQILETFAGITTSGSIADRVTKKLKA
jgi:thioredoxin 1